jgi:hypothetical protein
VNAVNIMMLLVTVLDIGFFYDPQETRAQNQSDDGGGIDLPRFSCHPGYGGVSPRCREMLMGS